VRPLGKLLVAKSYSTRVGEKTTKTDAVKHVPVHPTLAAMLAEWKLGGWAEMMGRAPGPDDLIVPLPPDAAERRYKRKVEPFRTTYLLGQVLEQLRPRGAGLAAPAPLRHARHVHHARDRRRRGSRRARNPRDAHPEVSQRVRWL